MANTFTYKEDTFKVGDTIAINYTIKEGEKERQQLFEGMLLRVKGSDANNRMITVRKISHTGVGVERIIPLNSPFIAGIKSVRKSNFQKSRLYFIRGLSDQKLRNKLYGKKREKIAVARTARRKTSAKAAAK